MTALVDPECTLNGQVLVSGGGVLRAASAVEWGPVRLPDGRLTPDGLSGLIAESRQAPPMDYSEAIAAFHDLAAFQDLAAAPEPVG